MDSITAALEARDAETLISLCEEAELTSATKNLPHPHAALHLVCLLLQNDLTESRFLWKRLPPSERQKEDVAVAWRAAHALWRSELPSFYTAVTSHVWPAPLQPLIDALLAAVREAAVGLIRDAYSVVGIERAAALLGLDRAGVLTMCEELSWDIDGDCVVPVQSKREGRSESAEGGSYRELQTLTEQLVRLQTST